MVIVYALCCKPNGKAYIGSTRAEHRRKTGRPYHGLGKRLREHRCLLRADRHGVFELQQDWRRFGEDAFDIGELERVPDELIARRRAEEYWMQRYRANGLLYNEHVQAMRPTDAAIRRGVANAHRQPGNRWTAATNEKRRLAQLGKPKGHGAKISATKRAKRAQMMR